MKQLKSTDFKELNIYTTQCQLQQHFLDNRLFRAFMAAAETENFTSAAKLTFMTQSGISQHIAKLEKQVGLPLFKRVAKRVTLTKTGRQLKKYIEENSTQTESFLDQLHEDHNGIAGPVSFAMPPSFLALFQYLVLLEQSRQHPKLTLHIKLIPSHSIAQMVLDDQIDFGLVSNKLNHPSLTYNTFYQEEYVLAASSDKVLNNINATNIHLQHYIAYPSIDTYFNSWLKYHFPRRKKTLDYLSLPISGSINSIEGAIAMVQLGIGISVFPKHCINNLLMSKQLYEFRTKRPPLKNNLYIVSLRDYAYPQAIRKVMTWLF
jgi:DNA-binding transcriptional LysR family regulator